MKNKGRAEGYRLNRFLARAGVASRRKCDDLIAGGMVSVNGKTVTSPGFRVHGNDSVSCMGEVVEIRPTVTAALNKPHGYETTMSPDSPRSIIPMIRGLPPGTVPVGRLDVNTGGLLLLSNDGDLTYRLTHPSWEVEREYRVFLDSAADGRLLARLRKGASIGKGEYSRPLTVTVSGAKSVNIILHTGRNREVRRLFKACGANLMGLERVRYGPVSIDGIKRGEYRILRDEELFALRALVGLDGERS